MTAPESSSAERGEDTDLTAVISAMQDQIDELRAAIDQQQRDLDAQRQTLRTLQQD